MTNITDFSSGRDFSSRVSEICLREKTTYKREQAIKDMMVDSFARDSFKLWANDHPDFLDNSPFYQNIFKTVEVIESKESTDSKVERASKIARKWTNSKNLKEIEELILSNSPHLSNFLAYTIDSKAINMILEYTKLGFLNEQSFPYLYGNFAFTSSISNLIGFEHISQLTDLAVSHPLIIQNIFGFSYKGGLEPLHNIQTVTLCLPVLKKLAETNVDILINLLSMKNEKGYSPLFDVKICQSLMPILESVKPQTILVSLFSQKNSFLQTIIHYPDTCEQVLPILKNFYNAGHTKSLVELITARDSINKTPLHYENTFDLLIPILEMIGENDPQLLVDLFLVKDFTMTLPIEDPVAFRLALPSIERMNLPLINQIFVELTNMNYTILYNPEIFELSLPLLKNIYDNNPDYIVDLLSSKNSYGDTLLHHEDIFFEAVPLIEKMAYENPVLVERLFSQTDSEGNYPQNSFDVFSEAIDVFKILCNTNPEIVYEIFSQINSGGNCSLQDPEFFLAAKPVFERLAETNIDQFAEFLMKPFGDGLSILESILYHNFELVTGLIELNRDVFLPLINDLALKGNSQALELLITNYSNTPFALHLTNVDSLRIYVQNNKSILLSTEIELPSYIVVDGNPIIQQTEQRIINALKDVDALVEFLDSSQTGEILIRNEIGDLFIGISPLCLGAAAIDVRMAPILLNLSQFMTPIQHAYLVPFLESSDFVKLMQEPKVLANPKLLLKLASVEQVEIWLEQFRAQLHQFSELKTTLPPEQINIKLVSYKHEQSRLRDNIKFYLENNQSALDQKNSEKVLKLKTQLDKVMADFEMIISFLSKIETVDLVPIDAKDEITDELITNLAFISGGALKNTMWVDVSTLSSLDKLQHPTTRQPMKVVLVNEELVGWGPEEEGNVPDEILQEFNRRKKIISDFKEK